MIFIDYYQVLKIDKTATPKDIKNAYRKLARKFHPDLNPSDNDSKMKFQQINEANEVLSNPEKRAKYDKYGKDWQHADEFEKAQQHQYSTSGRDGSRNSERQSSKSYSDFFESMFGDSVNEGRRQQSKFRGEDYSTEFKLSLIDAYKTHKQTLTINGKKIRIVIPSGIENGQVIKIRGYGGKGINGGPDGDLYIEFSIVNHPQIKRHGINLFTNIDLDLFIAILGGEIIVETLNGKVKLNVKPETQNGSKVNLKGQGFPVYKHEGQFGDLQVTFNIKIPTGLTKRQIELFAELSKL